MAARARRQPAPEPAPVIVPVRPDFGAYRLDQLGSSQCHFPCSSEGSQHRFCGRPIAPRASGLQSSWCADHLTIVFEPWCPGGRVLRRVGRD
ncbi:hypothetical protein MKK75_03195 [Methylobacterium sp. J-030]|uniref:hypothetical protein n=1 Tax=Methylobacterium sp. J-030 TaxID=2836627 RepID=UPI001FBB7428|nr:hypothetical protein [Methylobacterium sp. J-030]MCJ2067822.1 hypothetical protein [Methylobacterium sp. J-030]